MPLWLVGLVYLLVIASVGSMLSVAERALLSEVRSKARNLAALVASHLPAETVAPLREKADVNRAEFKQLLRYVQLVKQAHPDVAFVYLLRRVEEAQGVKWSFVIDAQPEDIDQNGNGTIEPEEEGVKPGRPYDDLTPEMLEDLNQALRHPVSSRSFYSDHWGSFISGYAPVHDPVTGKTIAVVGIDVARGQIGEKYRVLHITAGAALIILLLLMTLTLRTISARARALDLVRSLDAQLEERNRQLEEQNLTLEHTIQELTDRENERRAELALAEQVQQRFLPSLNPFAGCIEFGSHYRAAGLIGGDLYDVFSINDDVLGFFIADVTGHGVSAALITAALKVSVERYRQIILETAMAEHEGSLATTQQAADTALRLFLHRLNGSMCEIMLPGQFVTMQVGLVQLRQGRLMLGNAGHLRPLRWNEAHGGIETVELPSNVPLGLFPGWTFETASLPWHAGDKLVLYTDGVIEQRNAEDEEYGLQNLIDVVDQHHQQSARQLAMLIVQSVRAFGQPLDPQDDQALLIVAGHDGAAARAA